MDKKLVLLVAAHKVDNQTRRGGVYLPIQVGKALHPELNLGFQSDNQGDNISERNASWCELTALYWGWKNLHEIKYLGLNHYRRYFKNVNEDNIDHLMSGFDMIVVKQSNPMLSNHERPSNLSTVTTYEDYFLFADAFLTIHPEYKKEFIDYFYNSRASYPYQMFISTKERYDDYCEFMFPVLFEVEKNMRPHGYTRQKRSIGYMGEYFLGLYISCKHLKVRPIPIEDGSIPHKTMLQNVKHQMLLAVKKTLTKMLDLLYKVPKDIEVPSAVAVGFKADGIKIKSLKS